MAKIIVTSDGKLIQEVELVQGRVTIGRKPHNDIAIEHRAVSGQHATITLMLDEAMLEDMGSTNGTFINGEKVYRHKLVSGDKVSIAIFELHYVATLPKPAPAGRIEVLSGAHAGKQLALNKPLTTIGKPGSAVVAITYAAGVYTASRIEGERGPSINDVVLGKAPVPLAHGDALDLAGTKMTFLVGQRKV